MIGPALIAIATAAVLPSQTPTQTQVDPALLEARSRYDAVAYDEALAILEAALVAPGTANDGRARVQAFIGVVRAQMGDEAAARAAFHAAVALDPCVAFPNAAAPPGIHALFAEAKQRAAQATQATTATTATQATQATQAPTAPPRHPSWLVPAGLAFASAGAVTLLSASVVGAVAVSTNAQAQAAPIQNDAIALDAAGREQAVVANSLALLGGVLVVGGGTTAAIAMTLE